MDHTLYREAIFDAFFAAPNHNAEKQEWELKSSSWRHRLFLLNHLWVSAAERMCIISFMVCLQFESKFIASARLRSVLYTIVHVAKVGLNNRESTLFYIAAHACRHTLSVCADADKKELVLVSAHIATFIQIQRSASCVSEFENRKKWNQ